MNHSIIENFFKEQSFFGWDAEDFFFFQQDLEPCFTFDGKMIVESTEKLSMAPDGNGGIYKAMIKSGALADMQERGVEHLHVYGIDNVLTQSIDPLFLGLCIRNGVEVGNKVVWRQNKAEKVGVTAENDGRMYVLEYSEIPADLADAADTSTGKLLFGAANICNHYLSLSFLVTVVAPQLSGMYHVANKKIPFLDASTMQTVQPTENNGVKLEMFIFDIFPLASKWIVVESNRADEFAPVKNAPGSASDSPNTARVMINNQSIKWLQNTGAVIEEVQGGDDTNIIEVSPLVSYGGEGLEHLNGNKYRAPHYIS
jgi:UDP-N-acetylglucosamine/UDP-N-acetylgalactosamine diphosphorylase